MNTLSKELKIDIKNKLFINRILDFIYKQTKFDFREYRETTLYRRISRRFYFAKADDFSSYFKFLIKNREEQNFLVKDLTINVTEFFRDKKIWESLNKKYLSKIIENVLINNKKEIKIWCAGCSSGEEAYSIAILFKEYINNNNIDLKLNILATDIDTDKLETAKKGIYKISEIGKQLPEQFFNKYFNQINDTEIEVSQDLKKYITFEFHSLVTDKYPDSIDFLSCRNVFIFFSKILQNKILVKFINSLSDGAWYLQGNAEYIADSFKNYFEYIDDKNKFYKKLSEDYAFINKKISKFTGMNTPGKKLLNYNIHNTE